MTTHKGKKQLPVWQESILLVVTALVMAAVIKAFFVQAFYIPSGSMEATLLKDDKLLVQKWSFWSGEPERGDIVVFDDPGGWLPQEESVVATNGIQRALEAIGLYPTGGHLIKRVIGVGGDEVKCCDDQGRTTVNGQSIDETYLLDQAANGGRTFDVKVPDGHVWVEGDNRGDSADSRYHQGDPGGGFVPVEDIVGKAWLRVWPIGRWGILPGTDAFDEVGPPSDE